MLKIDYLNVNEAKIKINKKDYDKVLENKTIYEVKIESYDGMIKIRRLIFDYKYILIFIIVSLMIVYFLSNLIFKIEIVTNDKEMKEKITNYLNDNGIKLYHLKKNYSDLQKIKKGILNKYKSEIDWIEIDNIGTKYIVRYEPRISTKITKENKYQNIIASKNAFVYSMDISKGQIIKNRFDYVKKGDVIVSGYIYFNEQVKNTVKASGVVYGETWYKVKVKYPLKYESKIKTGKKKNVITIKIFNNEIQLFNLNKYKNYNKRDTILLKNNILPISINYQKQEQLKVEKENNNYNEAYKKAIKCAKDKISKKFDDKSYIKDIKVLKENKKDNYIYLEIFISAVEIISDYQPIDKEPKVNNE